MQVGEVGVSDLVPQGVTEDKLMKSLPSLHGNLSPASQETRALTLNLLGLLRCCSQTRAHAFALVFLQTPSFLWGQNHSQPCMDSATLH